MERQEKTRIERLTVMVNRMLNSRINTATRFQNNSVLWRHVECAPGRIAIQPTYSDILYNPQKLFDSIKKCGCTFYIEVKPNLANVPAPVVHIYDPETL